MDADPENLWRTLGCFAGYVVLLWAYMFLSEQKAVPRRSLYFLHGVARIAVLHGLVIGLGLLLGYDLNATLATFPKIAAFFVVMLALLGMLILFGEGAGQFEPVALVMVSVTAAVTTILGGLVLFVLGPGARESFVDSLSSTSPEEEQRECDARESEELFASLHDFIGTVSTPLKPQGRVQIDGKLFDARSDAGAFVESGSRVRVVGHRGKLLLVACDDLPLPSTTAVKDTNPAFRDPNQDAPDTHA